MLLVVLVITRVIRVPHMWCRYAICALNESMQPGHAKLAANVELAEVGGNRGVLPFEWLCGLLTPTFPHACVCVCARCSSSVSM